MAKFHVSTSMSSSITPEKMSSQAISWEFQRLELVVVFYDIYNISSFASETNIHALGSVMEFMGHQCNVVSLSYSSVLYR